MKHTYSYEVFYVLSFDREIDADPSGHGIPIWIACAMESIGSDPVLFRLVGLHLLCNDTSSRKTPSCVAVPAKLHFAVIESPIPQQRSFQPLNSQLL